jgi:hypothetical protein
MVRTTREQREALKRIYDRAPLYQTKDHGPTAKHYAEAVDGLPLKSYRTLTYRQFRRLVQPTFGCDGAVVAPWCGMWLCIETDGYTHS